MAQPSRVSTAIIFAGGMGSRLGEYNTQKIPKPLITVAGKPIIMHIMDTWIRAGVGKFVVAGGYNFQEFFNVGYDFSPYSVKFLFTGHDSQTGDRLKMCLESIDDEQVAVSYGDGITTFPLEELIQCHFSGFQLVSMLVTHPISRFGEVKFGEDGIVTSFSEKPIEDKWINAGYFVVSREILPHLDGENQSFEADVLPKLVSIGEPIKAVPCNNFWHCMDTPKDVNELNKIWKENENSWPIYPQ